MASPTFDDRKAAFFEGTRWRGPESEGGQFEGLAGWPARTLTLALVLAGLSALTGCRPSEDPDPASSTSSAKTLADDPVASGISRAVGR